MYKVEGFARSFDFVLEIGDCLDGLESVDFSLALELRLTFGREVFLFDIDDEFIMLFGVDPPGLEPLVAQHIGYEPLFLSVEELVPAAEVDC